MKKSSIQCPSCPHHVFEGTLICKFGKLTRPDQEVMNRIKEAFEMPKAPYYHTSTIAVAATSPQGSRRIAEDIRKLIRRVKFTQAVARHADIRDKILRSRWQNDETHRKSQLAHNWSDAWVRYLDHIVHFNINHNAPHPQRERYVNLLHSRIVDDNNQAGPLWHRLGYRDAKKELFQAGRQAQHVEFVFMDSKLARRQMVRTMVKFDNTELTFSNSSGNSMRRRRAQRCHHQPVSLTAVLFLFYKSC